ncbi:competence protein ComEC [bacterium]|nr:competence protein ComEC [bacterium]|tara:strand:- start:16570 stop:17424 length:855 start_codon:yes stop_codon:yes gene_type:complete
MESIRQNAKWYFLGVLFFANALIWCAIFGEERAGILTVAFLDVGQGDAVFIEAPNGNQMLIDGGGNTRVLQELSTVMPFYDRSIDVVLATHPDKDHIGGLPAVLKNFKVDYFIEPGIAVETGAYEELVRLIALEGSENVIARRGMKIFLDEKVYLLVLFPDRDMSGVSANDASIIAKLIYEDTSFLFTGDASQKMENFVVSLDGKMIDVDVLKIGHHGSKTSTSDLFLGYASPLFSVISAGVANRYGHPHEEVIARLEQFESEILRTDEQGTIIFKSDGKNVRN